MLPIGQWLPGYSVRKDLAGDLISGFDNFSINASEAVSYAMTLLHIPAARGLLACMVPSLVYSVVGRDASVGVGPLALTTTLTYSTLRQVNDVEKEGSGALADARDRLLGGISGGLEDIALLSLIVGIAMSLMGLLGRERIGLSMSRTIIRTITLSTAVVIEANMLFTMLGIRLGGEKRINDLAVYEMVFLMARKIKSIHLPTLGVSVCSLIYLEAAKKLKRSSRGMSHFPEIFALIAATILISEIFNLRRFNIEHINVQDTLNLKEIFTVTFDFSTVTIRKITKMIPSAALIVILSFVEMQAISIGRSQTCLPSTLADSEMLALGVCNACGSLFGSWPVFAGLGRSVVKTRAGAKTPLSEAISSLFALFTLLWTTHLVSLLPKATCAAIVFRAVTNLFGLKEIVFAVKGRYHYHIFSILSILLIGFIMNLEAACFTAILFSVLEKTRRIDDTRISSIFIPTTPPYVAAVISIDESSIDFTNCYPLVSLIESLAAALLHSSPRPDNPSHSLLALNFHCVKYMDCNAALALLDVAKVPAVKNVTLCAINMNNPLSRSFIESGLDSAYILDPAFFPPHRDWPPSQTLIPTLDSEFPLFP